VNLYIYIYNILWEGRHEPHVFFCLFYVGNIKQAEENGGRGMFYLKARAITSGETPQKSLILPPVHTFIKVLVAPVDLMFSYFLRIFGG